MLVFIQRVRRIAIVFLSTALAVISLVGVPAGATTTSTITGTVTNASHVGIGGVGVDAQIVNKHLGATTTASNGSYTISNLPAGTYTVYFYPSGVTPPYYADQSIGSVTVTADASTTQNATLALGGTITGTVTNASHVGIGGVCVDAQIGNNNLSATTASNGSYTIAGLAVANYTVSFDPTCYDTVTSTYAQQSIGSVIVTADASTAQNATLTLGGTITGTVTNASHVGIGGVCVYAGSGNAFPYFGTATTASNGSYTISHLPAATFYFVRFTPTCYGRVTSTYAQQSIEWVTVTAGGRTTQNATLALGGSITGTVTNASHVGISGVCVDASAENTFNYYGSATTASNGSYTITDLTAGTYTVSFDPTCGGTVTSTYAQQSIASVIVTADASTTQKATLALGGSITGTVTNASHAGISGVCVDATSGNGPYGIATIAINGSYTISNLLAGTYTVRFDPTCHGRVTSTYAQQSTGSVIVTADASTTQNVTLSTSTSTITGMVTNASNVGMAGVCVDASAGNVLYSSIYTGGNGSYTISNLPAGTYTVRFEPTCGGTVSIYAQQSIGSVTVTADGSTTQNVTLVMRAQPTTRARPATLNVGFAAGRSSLGLSQERALTALAKKLVSGASVFITGDAKANTALARSRATAVAKFLSSHVKFKIHVTLKTLTNTAANKVTVSTTRP